MTESPLTYPAWILPAAPKLQGKVTTHSLESHETKFRPFSNLHSHVQKARDRHEKWKKMLEMGYTPAQIAEKYRVTERAVRNVGKIGATGPTVRRPIVVDGIRYESQDAAFKALKVRKQGLRKLIQAGRAKYVRP